MNELINKYIGSVQKFRIQLETLTPVAVRSGEVLSPLTDYHIEGNKLYLIDTDKLMADINQNNCLDDFERKVLKYSGNHSGGTETGAKKKKNFIANFLKEFYNSEISSEKLKSDIVKITIERIKK